MSVKEITPINCSVEEHETTGSNNVCLHAPIHPISMDDIMFHKSPS